MFKIRQFIWAMRFSLKSLFSAKIGPTLVLPASDGFIAYTRGTSFPIKYPHIDCLEYFRHFVPKAGAIVFDVGGELGYEAEQFSQIVGGNGKVFSFECLPRHIEYLKEIASRRKNVVIVDKACWNSNTELTFYQGHTPGSNTALPDAKGQHGQELADRNADKLVVQARTLDSLWEELTGRAEIDFLKMDIEGAEYEALAGATELLRHTAKVVIAAYHIRDGQPTAQKVKEMLSLSGFKVRVDENLHVYGTR